MRKIVITRPDDWHVHLRDNETLAHTVFATAKHFARALVMPNLKPALTSVEDVLAYRQRILKTLSPTLNFEPYMTLYLNKAVQPDDLQLAKREDFILGAKFYPAGATTNSEEGASSIKTLYPLLDIMQEQDLVLQIHGEVTHGDIFSREALFIANILTSLIKDFPKLRVVLEHISTQAAVDFVTSASKNVAATITPHHLLYNRNDLLVGGIKPHYYCLPILKDEQNQKAVQQAALSGNPRFFAGTDSAPHAIKNKESACGCAGIYSAPFAVALYTEFFDRFEQLSLLDNFMGKFGANFYQLPFNQQQIELIEQTQVIPQQLSFGHEQVVPVAAGSSLKWCINEGE